MEFLRIQNTSNEFIFFIIIIYMKVNSWLGLIS